MIGCFMSGVRTCQCFDFRGVPQHACADATIPFPFYQMHCTFAISHSCGAFVVLLWWHTAHLTTASHLMKGSGGKHRELWKRTQLRWT